MTEMKVFALPLAFMLALVLLEMLVLKWHRRVAVDWRDMVLNLNSGHVLMLFFRGFEVAGFAWLLKHASFGWIAQWPIAAQWAFAFVAWDFCFYWLHRLHHAVPAFWAVHAVHHEGEHFNLSLGIRNSWFSSLTSLPFFAVLAVLGLPLHVFVFVGAFHYGVQFYNHNAIVGRSGWLDRWFVTPANHRVHHGSNEVYIDRNFGGTLLIWDKLFGTFQRELPEHPIRFGVHERTPSTNPLWANLVPVLRLVGLRPAVPQPRVRMPAGNAWIVFGGVVLYGAVIVLLHWQSERAPLGQALLMALIFAGTISLGAASDGHAIGHVGCALVGVLGAPLVFEFFPANELADVLLGAAWFMHGFDAALRLHARWRGTSGDAASAGASR